MKMNSQTFCSLPFVHISNRTNGDIVPCCLVDEPLKRASGQPFNLADGDTFESAFRSDDMKSLQENLKNGIRDSRCRRCWDLEDSGAMSKRQYDGEKYLEIAESRAQNAAPVFKPLSWDLKLGTHCNLTCRMCDEESSSSILREKVRRKQIDADSASIAIRRTGDFTTLPLFREEIRTLAPHAEEVYLLGGEPTLMKGVLPLLDDLIAFGSPENTTLRWSTNLTHFSDELIARAKKFKNVVVDCSIDGYGPLNDYIRVGSTWSDIDLNAQRIRQTLPEAHIKVVCTVSVLNVFSLRNLSEWCLKRDVDLAFNFLDGPDFLNAKILPESTKARIIESYSDLNSQPFLELQKWLPGGESPRLMDQFLVWNKKEDEWSGQNSVAKKVFDSHFAEFSDNSLSNY